MTWTPQCAPTPAKPPVSRADSWISISALVLTVLVGAGAAVKGLFLLAFLVVTVVQLVRRELARPFAVGAGGHPA